MARGWHSTKLSIECPGISHVFFWHVLCVTVPFFLSFLSCFCFVFMLSLELCFVDVPQMFFLPSRPRTRLATTYITGYG